MNFKVNEIIHLIIRYMTRTRIIQAHKSAVNAMINKLFKHTAIYVRLKLRILNRMNTLTLKYFTILFKLGLNLD